MLRIGRDIRLCAVRRNPLALFGSVAVLSAHRAAQHVFVAHGLDGVQDLRLLVAHGVGVERDRRLHRRQADQLHDVVRHHVAQRSGMIEVAAASLHAHRLRHRDLHVVDVAAVPDRLKDSVGEAERQDVLHRLFAQIMIDAVDLRLVRHFQQLLVQRFGRLQIVSEGLLDDHPPPVAVLCSIKPGGGKFLHNRSKKTGRGRQVVKEVLMRRVFLIHLGQKVFELRVEFVVVEVSRQVVETARRTNPRDRRRRNRRSNL